MRIYLKFSRPRQIVPWNYQQKLVGAFHKWVGENDFHDLLSLYSLSGLMGQYEATKSGLRFLDECRWFISSPNSDLLKAVLEGVMRDAKFAFGMEVREVVLRETPTFSGEEYFGLASPVLIKRTIKGMGTRHFRYDESEADELMTLTLKSKLKRAGLEEDVKVRFDRTYSRAGVKLVDYKGVKNKTNFCPVIVSGSPKAIGFAWEVGIGNSTGIGFGALR